MFAQARNFEARDNTLAFPVYADATTGHQNGASGDLSLGHQGDW
jgi:hypothetical protein